MNQLEIWMAVTAQQTRRSVIFNNGVIIVADNGKGNLTISNGKSHVEYRSTKTLDMLKEFPLQHFKDTKDPNLDIEGIVEVLKQVSEGSWACKLQSKLNKLVNK